MADRNDDPTEEDLRSQFAAEYPELNDPACTDARTFERRYQSWLDWQRED